MDALGGAMWRKARKSATGNCVQVAALPDGFIGLRDSKDPHGPVLRYSPEDWAAFMSEIKAGAFDDMLACPPERLGVGDEHDAVSRVL